MMEGEHGLQNRSLFFVHCLHSVPKTTPTQDPDWQTPGRPALRLLSQKTVAILFRRTPALDPSHRVCRHRGGLSISGSPPAHHPHAGQFRHASTDTLTMLTNHDNEYDATPERTPEREQDIADLADDLEE